jgi:SAM-dependent methyltransferase
MAIIIDILKRFTPNWIRRRIPAPVKIWIRSKTRQDSPVGLHFLFYDLNLPAGQTEKSIFQYLSSFYFEDATKELKKELVNYLREAFGRFLYTLSIMPKGKGKLLEIGSNPYFMSMLIRNFTKYELYCSNFFAKYPRKSVEYKVNHKGEKIEFKFSNFNIESDDILFENDYFDVILFCEVIEHLTKDPIKALLNIKNILKADGYLILSTPNVCRLENVAKMITGVNIYDPYSGYGPYGRHNREYNKHELVQLLSQLGFGIEIVFTSDVHDNVSDNFYPVSKFIKLVQHRKLDLGQYLFVRAKNSGKANTGKPQWLYRSYPSEEMLNYRQ